jgi:segregation and condensation protein B
METARLKSIIESVLFISGEPVKIGKIAKIAEVLVPEVEKALSELSVEYATGRGLILVKKDDEVLLSTNPENSSYISGLIKSDIQDGLSQAGLETLSIVAYRGPITRVGIEAIRGVNSSFTVRALLMRGLLERVDNPQDSRSYLYRISFDFLKKLGVDSVEKLPDFESLSKDKRIEGVIKTEQE